MLWLFRIYVVVWLFFVLLFLQVGLLALGLLRVVFPYRGWLGVPVYFGLFVIVTAVLLLRQCCGMPEVSCPLYVFLRIVRGRRVS